MYQQKTAVVARVICFVLFLGFSLDASAVQAPAPGQDPYARAVSAWEKGDWDKALDLCDESLKADRQYKEAWLLKAQIYWQMKNHKMAVHCFDEYLEIDPGNVIAWVNRADNLFGLERYREMQESFDRALSIDPKCKPLFESMGVDYFLMGNFQESYKAFQVLQEMGETNAYLALTRRMLQIVDPAMAPPKSWQADAGSYQTVLQLTDSSKAGFLVNLTSVEGTAIRFGGSPEAPFRYAPNFEVWDGTMIFDRKGAGLLANGTHYRYKRITGNTLTVEEGRVKSWRLNRTSKKSFLITQ